MNEFELIYRYFNQQTDGQDSTNEQILVSRGIGDDAAVLDIVASQATAKPATTKPVTTKLVTCVDTLVQGRHFSDDWDEVNKLAFAIGYKAVAVNVSDLAAMGAAPHSILLALALPQRLANAGWLSEFAKGLRHACTQFGLQLIGGDTTRHDKLVISITANGVMATGVRPIYRSTADFNCGRGDKVYVSGTLGDACYALHHPNTQVGKQLAHRLHMPMPRVQLGQVLANQTLFATPATAMIDVSDGLVQDLAHIAKQSGVIIRLDIDNLPTSAPLHAVELTERLRCQLSGGDDYELLFTLPSSATIPDGKLTNNTPVTCIGEVIGQADTARLPLTYIELYYQGKRVDKDNSHPFITLPDLQGFRHF